MDDRPAPPVVADPDRRRFVLGAVAVAAGAFGLQGCQGAPEEPVFRVPLSSLPDGEPHAVTLGDEPVMLLRRGDEVTALSGWCSHMGCKLRWNGEERQYECPCHEGLFDESGAVISGPPKAPLRALTARVQSDTVIIEPDVVAGG